MRIRRRISSTKEADALISKCRDRSVTDRVVSICTVPDLMDELGITEESASVLIMDDMAWESSVWPLFESMAEAGIQATIINEARVGIISLAKTQEQLKFCSPKALKDAQVPLAVRVWLQSRLSV